MNPAIPKASWFTDFNNYMDAPGATEVSTSIVKRSSLGFTVFKSSCIFFCPGNLGLTYGRTRLSLRNHDKHTMKAPHIK